jgi:hypothetical protein
MSRLTSLKRLAFAALATAGIVAACRAAQPGEAPPLAPRPEIGPPTSPAPVPGAPDPLPDPGTPGPNAPTEDAGVAPTPPVSQIEPPVYQSYETPITPLQARDAGAAGPDAGGGGRDAAPRLDAAIPDAPRDAAIDAPPPDAPAPRRDAAVPDARDSGVGLPPVPDATLPPDAVRPMH